MYYAVQNCMTEWSFTSGKIYHDPFNEVTLDVMLTDPDGEEHRVPALRGGPTKLASRGRKIIPASIPLTLTWQVDPYRHPVTIHPGSTAQSMSARDMIDEMKRASGNPPIHP